MQLDKFLPAYEYHEVHAVTVDASPERVFAAIKELAAADLSPLVFLLIDIRNLPARLLKKATPGSIQSGPFLDQLYKGGFIPLREEAGTEIVSGWLASSGN